MDISTQSILQKEKLTAECEYPYIPGHFHLREAPVIIELLARFEKCLVLIDGNGILHPRRMGLASYVGVKLDIPTIGVAKKLLLGTVEKSDENEAPVMDNSERIGSAVWLHEKKRPIYVSIGHKVSLETAVRVVRMSAIFGYPEPLRQAHLCSRNYDIFGNK